MNYRKLSLFRQKALNKPGVTLGFCIFFLLIFRIIYCADAGISQFISNFVIKLMGFFMAKIRIKNMVCPRCIAAVKRILQSLGLVVHEVTLGEALVAGNLDEKLKADIALALEAEGFELLDDPRSALVESVKNAVIEWVRNVSDRPKLSLWITSKVSRDYGALSRLFTEVCGITIERYCILQRIERAKELMCYQELTLSEIAWELGYSSPAHLSSQFRQVTGISPSEFRDIHSTNKLVSRRSIDGL